MSDFLSWFKNAGGTLSPLVGITEFPGMSRGAVALDDIEDILYLLFLEIFCYLRVRQSCENAWERQTGLHLDRGGSPSLSL